MNTVKQIKDVIKKIAKQISDQNFFGSFPSFNEEFLSSLYVISDYKDVSIENHIIDLYSRILFVTNAEKIKNIAENSVNIDIFELPSYIKMMYNEVISEADNENLRKEYPDFYENNKSSDKYDQDILDYIYVLVISDSNETLEDIKNRAVFSTNHQITALIENRSNINKSHNLMQHLISMHGMVPAGPSTTISEISNEFFNIKAKTIEELVKKSGYSCMLLNKIQKNNYEYTIWNLTDKDFINKNHLEDDPRNGVNKVSIARLDTIRSNGSSSDNYDFSIKIFNDADTLSSTLFILDTHNGEKYRLLKKYNDIFISKSVIDKMLNPKTSSPRRLEILNTMMNNVIQSKVIQPPNLFPEEKIVWNNVNDKLSQQIISYFREYTKGKDLDYKILKKAIEDNEFLIIVMNSLLSFIKVRDIESDEVMLTIEFELNNNIKSLRGKMLNFIKSKKEKMKDYDKEKMLGFMVSDLPYILRQIFNSQANIFNSVMQKFLILKHFLK